MKYNLFFVVVCILITYSTCLFHLKYAPIGKHSNLKTIILGLLILIPLLINIILMTIMWTMDLTLLKMLPLHT